MKYCLRCHAEIEEGQLCANCLAFFWRLQASPAAGVRLAAPGSECPSAEEDCPSDAGDLCGGEWAQEKKALASKERLKIGFGILELVRERRLSSGDAGLGMGIECQILERELRELEEDLRRHPPVPLR